MNILQEVQKLAVKKVPDVKIGSTVRVHQKIKEGEKERVQVFEGLVIAINSGHGADKTFTVRKVVEGIGVEKVFPLYSPMIKKIEIKTESKVRRAKLYYMRGRSGKSARLKSTMVSDKVPVEIVEEVVEEVTPTVEESAPVAEDTAPEVEAK